MFSCSYLLIRLCPDNFCQHPDSELRVTSKLAVYTKLIPNLGNYPAILSLDDCTKTFLSPQIVSWDLGTGDGHCHQTSDTLKSLDSPDSLDSGDATWQSCGSLAMVSLGQARSDKPSGKWPSKIDKSVMKTCVCSVHIYMCSSECSLARGQDERLTLH